MPSSVSFHGIDLCEQKIKKSDNHGIMETWARLKKKKKTID